MRDECLICKAPLEYLQTDQQMECVICHKKEDSKTRCINGHYVCSSCHTRGIDAILQICLEQKSRDPIQILEEMMERPFCHMHGPEHHTMVGAALLTAYHNAGGKVELESALPEMIRRGSQVPGGVCGYWGACGAGISTGIFISLLSGSTPLTEEPWRLSNLMTAQALEAIGEIGGPRCCKRDSYLAIQTAVRYVREHFEICMTESKAVCSRSAKNHQCIGNRCPFAKS